MVCLYVQIYDFFNDEDFIYGQNFLGMLSVRCVCTLKVKTRCRIAFLVFELSFRRDVYNLTILPSPTLSTRWLTEEISLPFPFTIDTTTAGAPMS